MSKEDRDKVKKSLISYFDLQYNISKNVKRDDEKINGQQNLVNGLFYILRECPKYTKDKEIMIKLMDASKYRDSNEKHFSNCLSEIEYIDKETVIILRDILYLYDGNEFKLSGVEKMDEFSLNILFLRILIDSWGSVNYPKYEKILNYTNYGVIFENRNLKKNRPLYEIYNEFYNIYRKDKKRMIKIIYELSFFCFDLEIVDDRGVIDIL